jgi:GT2 family glycosyltransferase
MSQELSPQVSVIVPNYNGRIMLDECLRSLLELDYPKDRLEIIVVDNGSTDGSREAVRQKSAIRLITIERNEGFASAVNIGVRESTGELIALVNNDVKLTSKWLLSLSAVFSGDPTIGAATGRLLFKHEHTVVNDLGSIVLLNGAGFHRGLGTADTDTFETVYVGAPSGAACLIRRSAYLKAGGLDGSYFAYFEDVDLGWRFWQMGIKVICEPSAIAYHSWQSTSKRFGASFRVYHCAKNSFATFLKNAQGRFLPEAFLLWSLRLLLEVIRSLKSNNPHAILAIIKSLGWCYWNLRSILIKRSLIQQHRVICDSKLIRIGVLGRLRESITEACRLFSIGIWKLSD